MKAMDAVQVLLDTKNYDAQVVARAAVQAYLTEAVKGLWTLDASTVVVPTPEPKLSEQDKSVLASIANDTTTLTQQELKVIQWLQKAVIEWSIKLPGEEMDLISVMVDEGVDTLDITQLMMHYEDDFDVYINDCISNEIVDKMRWIDLVRLLAQSK